jgi:hypothetical protein
LCSLILGKTWGLELKKVHWLYTVVVRPMLMYVAIVWWLRVGLAVVKAELGRLQRLVCVSITGTVRMAPTAALEVLLGFPPLSLGSRG